MEENNSKGKTVLHDKMVSIEKEVLRETIKKKRGSRIMISMKIKTFLSPRISMILASNKFISLIFLIIFSLTFVPPAKAVCFSDYCQDYGQSDTEYLTVTPGTYQFEIDGIGRNKWTEWFDGEIGSPLRQNDYSGLYNDPTFEWTFSSGTTLIRAEIYDDNGNWEEVHRWYITVQEPFIPEFYNIRIQNKIDQDGDGYARQFDIEFDVDSNVSGQYYIKVYENDFIGDDYLLTSSVYSVNGSATDYHGVTIACDNHNFYNGTAEFKLKLYDASDNSLVETWTASDDSDLGGVKVELSNEDNRAPNIPTNPDPYDGKNNVSINADLNWNCSDSDGDTVYYTVYLEKDNSSPDNIIKSNSTGSWADPNTMDYDAHYYWKVKADDHKGGVTWSPVWDFNTEAAPFGTISIEARDSSNQKLPTTEINAVILYDENFNEIARKQPPSSNPMSFSNVAYGNYINDVYCWDMLAKRYNFQHASSTTAVSVNTNPKRTLLVTVYYADGFPFHGASVYLDSWNGQPGGGWTERDSDITDGNGQVSFQAWPTELYPDEKYQIRVISNGSEVGSNDNINVLNVEACTLCNINTPLSNPNNAEIVPFSFIPPTGPKERGDQVTATVRVKNTGTTTRKFWVGLSFAEELVDVDETPGPWPEGWYDVRPQQTASLSPQEWEDIQFDFIIPPTSPKGTYTARTAIWNGYDADIHKMSEPRYAKSDLQSFTLDEYPNPAGPLVDQLMDIVAFVKFDELRFGDMAQRYHGSPGEKCEKILLYFKTMADGTISGVPIQAGGSLIIDLADVFRVTPEGNGIAEGENEQWVTAWIDAEGGIAETATGINIDMGLLIHSFDYGEASLADDRRFISGGQAQFGCLAFTGVTYERGVGWQVPHIEFMTEFAWKVEPTVTIGELTAIEINKQIVLDALSVTDGDDLRSLADAIIDYFISGHDNHYFRDITHDDGNVWLDNQGDWATSLKCHKQNEAHYFYTEIPDGTSQLRIFTDDVGTGNADLYIQHGERPDFNSPDSSATPGTNEESIVISNPLSGHWYIMVYPQYPYEGVNLAAMIDNASPQPEISMSPSYIDFGSVKVGSSRYETFTVKNTGYGTFEGNASVSSPFTIHSGGSYSLAQGQTQTVIVRFSPTGEGGFNENVTFTGGGGATRPVSGEGAEIVDAPVIASISDHTIQEGSSYTGPTPTLTAGTQPITYSLITYPNGMGINPETGVVSWQNPIVAGSPHTITIRATNTAGYDDETWQLTVSDNIPPIVNITVPSSNQSVSNSTTSYDFSGTASDPDGTVTKVEYRVRYGSWMTASGITNWSFSVDLEVGPNFIEVRSWDNNGSYSETKSRTITREDSLIHYISGQVTLNGGTASVTEVLLTLSGAASQTTYPDASGNHSFTGLEEGDYTVTPSLTNYHFFPDLFSYLPLSSNQTAQNFTGLHETYDSDTDDLPDWWEQEIIDADPNDAITNVEDVLPDDDFDNDGITNLQEYLSNTDPGDSADKPARPYIFPKDCRPHDGQGIDGGTIRVPHDTSIIVIVRSSAGIDKDTVVMKVEGVEVEAVVKEVNNGDNTACWIIYNPKADFDFGQIVDVTIEACDVNTVTMEPPYSFSFGVETEQKYNNAVSDTPAFSEDDTNLAEVVISADEGTAIEGARIIYNSVTEKVTPRFGPINEIPELDKAEGIGLPVSLEPPCVFEDPVTIFIPCPDAEDLSSLEVYCYHPNIGWEKASEVDGWMVPGSRVDHPESDPPTIEIQVNHFTGVQAGGSSDGGGDDGDDPGGGSGGAAAGGGGGSGGCFIATAAFGSNMEPHVRILQEFRDRFMLTNIVGSAFVDFYYRHSPGAADFIAKHDSLRAIARLSLLPLVGMSWIALRCGLFVTMTMIFIFISGIMYLSMFRRNNKK